MKRLKTTNFIILLLTFQVINCQNLDINDDFISSDEVTKHDSNCELRVCTNWNITIIPLFKINFEKFQIIEDIVNTIIEDCRWRNYSINIKFLTKDFNLHDVINPMLPIELTTEMKLLSLYTEDEINAYRSSTIFVSENMIEADRDTGNYILVLTNIEDIIRNELVLNYVDRELHKKSIHLRVIQIVADPTKKISKGKIHHSYYKLLTRSKDSKGRVSLIETYDILDSVKPCPSLSNLQKIHQYGELLKERQINWALDHIEDFIVGGIFVLFAVLAGVLAAIYEVWNNKKLKKKEEMPIKS